MSRTTVVGVAARYDELIARRDAEISAITAQNAAMRQILGDLVLGVKRADERPDSMVAVECYASALTKAEQFLATTPSMDVVVVPESMDEHLAEILGKPNFWCGPLAHLFAAHGHVIQKKAEAEQAFVIHWLLKIYATHGPKWREEAQRRISALPALSAAGGVK